MKVRMGNNVYSARLRFSHRYQSWMIAVGPILISRVGLEAQGASLCTATPLEERQLAEAGFAGLLEAEPVGLADVQRLAS